MYKNGTSYPECAVFYYVKKIFTDSIHKYKLKFEKKNYEVDIFIPSISCAIEYDGGYWHEKKVDVDDRKNEILNKKGIFVIRIRAAYLPNLKPFKGETISIYDKEIMNPRDNISFVQAINQTIHILSNFVDDPILKKTAQIYDLLQIEDQRDQQNIYAVMYPAKVFPNFRDYCAIDFWSKELNGELDPENIPNMADPIPIYTICPEGIKRNIDTHYHRRMKSVCADRYDKKCENCICDFLCPYIKTCMYENNVHPIQCQYVYNRFVYNLKTRSEIRLDKSDMDILRNWFIRTNAFNQIQVIYNKEERGSLFRKNYDAIFESYKQC